MDALQTIVKQVHEQSDAYDQLYQQLQETRKQLQTARKILDKLFQNDDLADYSKEYLDLKKTLAVKPLTVPAPKKTAANAGSNHTTEAKANKKTKKDNEPETLNIIPTDPMAWLYAAPEQKKNYGKVENPTDRSRPATSRKSSDAPSPSIIKLLVGKEVHYLNPRSGFIYQRDPDNSEQAIKVGQIDGETGEVVIGNVTSQLQSRPTTPLKIGYQTYHQDTAQRVYEAVGLPRLVGHIGHLDSEGQLRITA